MISFGRIASKNWLSLVLVFLLTFSVSLISARFVRSFFMKNPDPPATVADESLMDLESTPSSGFIESLDLQPTLNSWVSETPGEIGVAIYDLDRNEISASYNADAVFSTDNLRNLLIAYDGYRQIDLGVENPDTTIVNATSYSSCLDDIIRLDDTICSEAILADPTRSERIESLISELGMTGMTELGKNATVNDYLKLLPVIWKHSDLSLDSWAKLEDSLLDQPSSNGINWREGLPSGFSTAKVYSKVSGLRDYSGNWTRYSNLAFVDFIKTGREFAVVVLSSGYIDLDNFSRLGTLIEGKVLEG